MSGMIIAIYFNALTPSLEIEENTRKNIINGSEKIKIFFIDKLTEYKNDFTPRGIILEKPKTTNNTPKNTRGIANVLSFW